MEGTQTVSTQEQSEQQQKVEQERSKLVTYTVKLPNGAKFTRLNPVNNRANSCERPYAELAGRLTGHGVPQAVFQPPRKRADAE